MRAARRLRHRVLGPSAALVMAAHDRGQWLTAGSAVAPPTLARMLTLTLALPLRLWLPLRLRLRLAAIDLGAAVLELAPQMRVAAPL